MHPSRWHILFRWIACGLIVLGVIAAIILGDWSTLFPRPPKSAVEQPPPLTLPSEEEKQSLWAAIDAMRSLNQRAAGPASLPSPSLLAARGANQSGKAQTELSLMLFSNKMPAVVLNHQPYFLGATLPDGRVIRTIDKSGVLLESDGFQEHIAWETPQRVELRKASAAPRENPQPAQPAKEPEKATSASGKQEPAQSDNESGRASQAPNSGDTVKKGS